MEFDLAQSTARDMDMAMALQSDEEDAGLVEAPRPPLERALHDPADLCRLADQHYAVSESSLDEARAAEQGNWVNVNSAAFKQKHSEIVEHEGPEDGGEDEAAGRYCESSIWPGLCARQLYEMEGYDRLMEDARNVLRWARLQRREKGFGHFHVLLLLVDTQGGDDEDPYDRILEMHLLTRLSFKPLDATAVPLERTGRNTGRVLVVDGAPQLTAMPKLVYNTAEKHKSLSMHFRTAPYTAESLLDLRFRYEPGASLSTAPNREVDGDDGNESSSGGDDKTMHSALQLLKKATGKATGRGRGRGRSASGQRGRGQGRASKGRGRRACKEKSQKSQNVAGPPVPEDDGRTGEVHREIMESWVGAVAEQLGVADLTTTTTATPSTSARPKVAPAAKDPAPKAARSDPQVPIMSTTHPWRDEDGYCWRYNERLSFLGR